MSECVLIVDEDDDSRESLELLLASQGHRVYAARDAKTAFERVESQPLDIVACSGSTKGLDGFALLPAIIRALPGIPVLMTSTASQGDLAREANSLGAYDYLAKPFQQSDVELTLRQVSERERLRRSNQRLMRDVKRATGERTIVAASSSMINLLELMERSAEIKANVLLSGERGTDKEVLARAIHRQSPRRDQPFISVDCGADTGALFESEFFGHARGVFAGADHARRGRVVEASGGTLFLDEVGELQASLQAKLLRVLEDEEVHPIGETRPLEVDVRVIATTSRDLQHEVDQGRFRSDLFYRLSVMQLPVPPLRDRREDIPLLCDHFLSYSRGARRNDVRSISDDALERLVAYSWPGNLRELEVVIERAILLANELRITLRELPEEISSTSLKGSDPSKNFCLKRGRRLFEADFIRRALRETGGNRTHAAKLLEISHRALLYKIKEYGIRD